MEESGHILIRYYLNVLKCLLTFWENNYKRVDWSRSFFFFRKNIITVFKRRQIGLNYSKKMWRNILHPHRILANMSSTDMCGTIALSPNMTKTHVTKLTWQPLSFLYQVSKHSMLHVVPYKSFNGDLGVPLKNERLQTGQEVESSF